jgi:hypothetical protein
MTMGTGKTIEQFGIDDVSGGCNYSDDVMAVTKNQSPDSMNVDFTNGRIRKRGGTEVWTSLGSLYDADLEYDVDQEYNGGVSNATAVGFSLVDFSDYNDHHRQVAHINADVLAYDRVTNSVVTLRSGSPLVKSYNAKIKTYLVQTYSNGDAPYYWNGVTTSLSLLSASAPGFKRAIEFQGFLIGFNTTANPMRAYYESTTTMIGGAYADYFTLSPAVNDDEVTEPFILNGRLYAGTKYGIFRISYVGGVTVFEFKQTIADIGVVPNTAQLVVTKDYGQVVLFLGTDKRLYMFDGSNLRTISDLYYSHSGSDTPISMDQIDDKYIENAFSIYDFTRRVYRLFVTKKAAVKNNYCMNVDIDTFAYYPYDNMAFSAGCMAFDNFKRPYLIAVDYNSLLHKLFIDTPLDNGVAINEYYTSPIIQTKGGKVTQGQVINMTAVPSSNANLLVYDRVDFRKTWSLRQKLPLASGRDKFLGTSLVLGSSVLGSEKTLLGPQLSINATFNTYQFKLMSDTPAAVGWEIYNMSVDNTGLVFGAAEAQR